MYPAKSVTFSALADDAVVSADAAVVSLAAAVVSAAATVVRLLQRSP
jgi:hypothetical protein